MARFLIIDSAKLCRLIFDINSRTSKNIYKLIEYSVDQI